MSAKLRLIISLCAIGFSIWAVMERPASLGLDLKGGTQVVLDLKPRAGQTLTSSTADQTVEVLRKRVDSLGVAEPNLQKSGNDRIIVELPGVSDPETAVNVIGKTAQLTVHKVLNESSRSANSSSSTPQPVATSTPAPTSPTSSAPTPTSPPSTMKQGMSDGSNSAKVLGQNSPTTLPAPPTTVAPNATGAGTQDPNGNITVTDDNGATLQLGPSILDGRGIDTAIAQAPDQSHTQWYLQIKFKGDGAKAWTKATAEAACQQSGSPQRQLAIVLDNKAISHPQVGEGVKCGEGITDSTTEVTGQFTAKEAKQLALLIRGGALPVDVQMASQQVVGPQLGKAAIQESVHATIIGGALTMLYFLIYYRVLGLLAAVALAVYALLSYAALLATRFTLTLSGIAGFVLAIAMAMDSNVLVYERVKEEFANGRSLRSSASVGFKNAWSAIQDSNFTTIIAGAVLFFWSVGTVKGFGLTLALGTVISVLVTVMVLSVLVTGLLNLEWFRSRPAMLGMYNGSKFRKKMLENPPNLIGMSKYFLLGSLVVIILSVSGIFVKGIDYGIEFTGGRLLEYRTAQKLNVDTVRSEVGNLGFPRAIIQQSQTGDVSIRVAEVTKEQETQIDDLMNKLGGGKADRIRDEKVGASFGKELKKKAVQALVIGVLCQLAFVAWRFRWTYGIGAVAGMIHDALLVLGVFVWLRKPFDAVFMAALLTVIAYSVNDTVVVFDRIREQRRRRASEPFFRVMNDACAQTFPRTLNIALSAVFIIGALLFVGGRTLSDFALALLIGVVTGVYSSVFIASPIATVLENWKPAIAPRVRSARQTKAKASKNDAVVVVDGETVSAKSGKPTSRPTPKPRKKKRR